MAKKLKYFDLNGLAESIRYILHYGGNSFEDVRYDRSKWPIPEVKDTLPYGQMPLYEEGGRTLNQSLAIARYLASQNNLLPSDPWDQAILDAAVLNFYDFVKVIIADVIKEQDPEKKEKNKQKILDETLPYYFSRFEKELKQNNGYFGGKLSWADFVFVGVVEFAHLIIGEGIENGYPTVKTLLAKVRNLPGVKEYIAKRKPYSF